MHRESKTFLKTFVTNLEVRTMLKFIAFFVFTGTELFKSSSISSLENSENLLCNAIFLKNVQLPLLSLRLS